MTAILSDKIRYKKRARLLAILWTLLIFFLCFLPGREIPDTRVPLADKWAHLILFAVFSFLWLASIGVFRMRHLWVVLACAVALGWLVELIQGKLDFLGRSQDNMDVLADGIGGVLGVVLFYGLHRAYQRKAQTR